MTIDRAAWTAVATASVWACMATMACNALSGADAIVLEEMDDDAGAQVSAGGSPGAGGAVGPGPGSGLGGDPSGPGAGPGPGSGGAGPATGSGAGTVGGGGDDPGPTVCEYPSGPYGVDQGQTVPPNLSWQGYAPGNGSPTTITIEDFFDCDGSKGIHAVLIDTSQFG